MHQLDETNNFLQTIYQNRIQAETEDLNSLLSIKDIEFLIKNLPIKKTSNPDMEFLGAFCQMLRKN